MIDFVRSDPEILRLVAGGNDFDEKYHWHSGKPLSDDYERTNQTFAGTYSNLL